MKSILYLLLCGVVMLAGAAALAAQQPLRLLTEHSPPGEYLDDDGKVTGATVALIRLLQHRLGEPGNIELLPWARAFDMAKAGPDIALFETTRSTAREPLFKWVGPLKHYRIMLYGRADRIATNAAILPSRLVACEYRNSALVDELTRLGFILEQNLMLTRQAGDCFDMLLRGRVDVTTMNDNNFLEQSTEFASQGVPLVAVMPVTDIKLYLAFSLDVDNARVARWQAALEQSYLDGSMRALYQGIYPEQVIARLEAFAAEQAAAGAEH